MKSQRLAPLLWTLWFLFCLRVLGQCLVAAGIGGFLPAIEHWYSGLIPYPILIQVQLALIVLLGKICGNFTRGQGWLVHRDHVLGKYLFVFSILYGGVMILRYIVSIAFASDQRWFGGTIPIFFHLVLGSFAFRLGRYHLVRELAHTQDNNQPEQEEVATIQ